MRPPDHSNRTSNTDLRGFSLVEVMVSMSILSILLLVIAQLVSLTQKTWTRSNARISQFREVRFAFDLITKNLSQATLGSYLMDERENPNDPTSPIATYRRKSDLQFVCGQASDLLPGVPDTSGHAVFFQAPLGVIGDPANAGLTNLLCGRGYFVQYGSDESFRPGFLPDEGVKNRFRVMEYSPYAESNSVYSPAAGGWFADAGKELDKDDEASGTSTTRGLTRPIADNIILLLLSPRLKDAADEGGDVSIAQKFAFDSKQITNALTTQYPTAQGTQNVLPPLVRVVMVAIDESSAEKLALADKLSELVKSSGASFNSATEIDRDIGTLEESLRAQRLNYRVFSTILALGDNR